MYLLNDICLSEEYQYIYMHRLEIFLVFLTGVVLQNVYKNENFRGSGQNFAGNTDQRGLGPKSS